MSPTHCCLARNGALFVACGMLLQGCNIDMGAHTYHCSSVNVVGGYVTSTKEGEPADVRCSRGFAATDFGNNLRCVEVGPGKYSFEESVFIPPASWSITKKDSGSSSRRLAQDEPSEGRGQDISEYIDPSIAGRRLPSRGRASGSHGQWVGKVDTSMLDKPQVCVKSDKATAQKLYSDWSVATQSIGSRIESAVSRNSAPIALFSMAALGYGVLVSAGRQYLRRREINYRCPPPLVEVEVEDLES